MNGIIEKKTMKNWIKIEENLPEEGTTVLFYNEKWIDDETCPEGIVVV